MTVDDHDRALELIESGRWWEIPPLPALIASYAEHYPKPDAGLMDPRARAGGILEGVAMMAAALAGPGRRALESAGDVEAFMVETRAVLSARIAEAREAAADGLDPH